MIKGRIAGYLLHAIDIGETLLNRVTVAIRSATYRTHIISSGPNSPERWEESYVKTTPPEPVTMVTSEAAKMIIGLTREHETLLETGCGSGKLSAELACSGRRVAVCDFSQPILEGVKGLFRVSGLNLSGSYYVDITQPMPFLDSQFDVVWSCGVLEHWTDEDLLPIVQQSARCARRCVISFVPNEQSLLYRYGRENAEAHGIAPWGREIPRRSLKTVFEKSGLIDVMEKTCCLAEAPGLIWATDPLFARKVSRWWNSIPDDDPVKFNQGYLLFTIGYKVMS